MDDIQEAEDDFDQIPEGDRQEEINEERYHVKNTKSPTNTQQDMDINDHIPIEAYDKQPTKASNQKLF